MAIVPGTLFSIPGAYKIGDMKIDVKESIFPRELFQLTWFEENINPVVLSLYHKGSKFLYLTNIILLSKHTGTSIASRIFLGTFGRINIFLRENISVFSFDDEETVDQARQLPSYQDTIIAVSGPVTHMCFASLALVFAEVGNKYIPKQIVNHLQMIGYGNILDTTIQTVVKMTGLAPEKEVIFTLRKVVQKENKWHLVCSITAIAVPVLLAIGYLLWRSSSSSLKSIKSG